jgi:hypothetical protein
MRKRVYDPSMGRLLILSAALFAAACTKANPAAKCSTGTCIDPAAPFCDVDGSVGGTPGMCLGVTCTPGDFKVCRGDVALTCNQMGDNYDELQCAMGCTPQAMGCKVCQAGQTVCANGEVQTCDANGSVTSSETCPLGCFESEPRCRKVDPSNGLAQFVDMVAAPPDFESGSGNVQIDTGTGSVKVGATDVSLPNFLLTAPLHGQAIRVIVVHDFHVAANATLYTIDSTTRTNSTAALAIIASGSITIDGTLNANNGGSVDPACLGGHGNETDDGTHFQAGASGGGGFATKGGSGTGINAPGLGGGASGGADNDNGTYSTSGAAGGGAIQLSASGPVMINGTIAADGNTGYDEQASAIGEVVYGGGAGGGILLEGATVTLGPNGALLTRGGGGGGLGGAAAVPANDANPIAGVQCVPQSVYCGNGGNGAAPGVDAQNGGIAQYSSTQRALSSGGGGGGLGRIRINSQSGTYTKASSSVEAGDLTAGVVGTR